MSDWDSKQYVKFERERTQPSVDLINRIDLSAPERVLDIGCGPGNSTAALAKRYPAADVLGIDSSADMLARAAAEHPELKLAECVVPGGLADIAGGFDLIFSNACIHWIPGQAELIAAVMEKLNPRGVFAVQIPLVQTAPFYKLLWQLTAEPEWSGKLGHIKNFHNLMPEEYYDILSGFTEDFTIWQTTYYHVVQKHDGIIQWYKGSGLRPYLEALDADDRARFERILSDRIKETYPVQADGRIILKMPRLFFTAAKPCR